MLYIGTTPDEKNALRVASHRGQVFLLARGIYCSEKEHNPVQLIQENLLAIIGTLLPDWHLSYSSAASLATLNGLIFVSSRRTTQRMLTLPGVKVIRQQDIKYPEIDWIEAPTKISSGWQREEQIVKISVSSQLQTVFECLSAVKTYSEKKLSESKLEELVLNLGAADRERASAFALRNNLQHEYYKLVDLMERIQSNSAFEIAPPRKFNVFFYGWQIGQLTDLKNECRFEYSPGWQLQLSKQLPLDFKPAYEGRHLPAFFENMLPEGWTESQLQATFKIAKEDSLGLLATAQKYLSNLTLRTDQMEEKTTFDSALLSLADLAPKSNEVLKVEDRILDHQNLQQVFKGLGAQGPGRVSGVQAKLPVSLGLIESVPVLSLGVLGNSWSHIIKYQSPIFPNMIENEWATMELAKRAGLNVATVRMIESIAGNDQFPGKALLIERYDIPQKRDLENLNAALRLPLQEDAASLLLLTRTEKYQASAERIANALSECGLAEIELWTFLKQLVFSWFVANGDMHAKNISIIRWLSSGHLGVYPQLVGTSYSPIYDLVNTKIYFPGEKFAIAVNGKNDKFRMKDFAEVAKRWGGSKEEVQQIMQEIAESIRRNIFEVLSESMLPKGKADAYKKAVDSHIDISMSSR